MADNVTVNSVPVVTREVTYSGDTSKHLQVVGLALVSGSDDAKVATDIPGDSSNGVDVDVTRLPAPPNISNSSFVTAGSTNAANIKASAGSLRSIHGFNMADYAVKICFHNTAGTPTAGVSVVQQHVVQAGSRIDLNFPGGGVAFATGIARTVVKVSTSADLALTASTAVLANDAQFEVGYV